MADDGEVLSLMAESYAAFDVRRWRREHLPERNLVSTLFELDGLALVGGIDGAIVGTAPVLLPVAVWILSAAPGRCPLAPPRAAR